MKRLSLAAISRSGIITAATLMAFIAAGAMTIVTASAQSSSGAQPTSAAPGQGSGQITLDVDSPDGGMSVANGQRVFIGGWAVATGGIRSVDIYLDSPQGAPLGSAKLGIARQDVASLLGHPEWGNSGYNFDWFPRDVSQGPHTIYVVANATSGQSTTQAVPVSGCGCGFTPSITNPSGTRISGVGWILDTGGPGLLIQRDNNDPMMGQ